MHRSLPASPQAPSIARSTIDAAMAGRCARETLETLRLVASELVTNSVQHAGLRSDQVIGLSIETGPGWVRIEVSDPGPGFVWPGDRRHPGESGGRGLSLVEALASRWGVVTDTGSAVWCEVALSAS